MNSLAEAPESALAPLRQHSEMLAQVRAGLDKARAETKTIPATGTLEDRARLLAHANARNIPAARGQKEALAKAAGRCANRGLSLLIVNEI
jgi:hypothetical protein